MKYFIANWKANKTLTEALSWADSFIQLLKTNSAITDCIVICPPFPFIYPLKDKFKEFKNIHLGAQDISQYEEGTYTGEVTAKNLSGLADFVIIGHSERRKNFSESDDIVTKKFQLASKYQIKSFYCISSLDHSFPPEVEFLCYEPIESISTGDGLGKNQSLDSILSLKSKLNLKPTTKFVYGGSVNENDVKDYLKTPQIDGFLVGGASLDPVRFFKLISP